MPTSEKNLYEKYVNKNMGGAPGACLLRGPWGNFMHPIAPPVHGGARTATPALMVAVLAIVPPEYSWYPCRCCSISSSIFRGFGTMKK